MTGRSDEWWLWRCIVKFTHGCCCCWVTHSHAADTQRQHMWADGASFICQISHIFVRFISHFYFCWWGDGSQKIMKSSGRKRCNGPWSSVGGKLTRRVCCQNFRSWDLDFFVKECDANAEIHQMLCPWLPSSLPVSLSCCSWPLTGSWPVRFHQHHRPHLLSRRFPAFELFQVNKSYSSLMR